MTSKTFRKILPPSQKQLFPSLQKLIPHSNFSRKMIRPVKHSYTSYGHADSESVLGFLRCVSPVKMSQKYNRYFEADLQTGQQKYSKVICFSPEKRAVCVQASENQQPVKLVDCRKAISQSDAGGYDVMLTGKSRVEAAEDVPFRHQELSSSAKKTVAEILRMGPRQKVGVVEVKVLQSTGIRMVPLNGQPMQVNEFAMCDPKGHTSLFVWGAQIVSVHEGYSYRLESLSTRKQADATVLTTTPSTDITKTRDVGQPSSMMPLSVGAEQKFRGKVTGVQIVVKPRCNGCLASQENLAQRSTTHGCERCDLLQLTESYSFSYSGVLIVRCDSCDCGELSGTLTNAAVYKYIRDNLSSVHAQSDLEQHLIDQGEMEVSTNGEGLVFAVDSARSAEPAAPLVVQTAGGNDVDFALDELFHNA